MTKLSRRSLLLAIVLAANFAGGIAMAKDGDSGGGSGNSGSGSGSSGSGSGGSGSGGGGGDDDDGDDGDDHEGNGGGGTRHERNRDNDNRNGDNEDNERARRAVRGGKAVSLIKLKQHLADNYPGKLLNVNLRQLSGNYIYEIRILASGNRIKQLSLNALTLQPRGD